VEFCLGDAHFATRRSKDAGTEASYSEAFDVAFDLQKYKNGALPLELDVYSLSATGQRKHIGIGSIPLLGAVRELGVETSVTVQLIHCTSKGDKGWNGDGDIDGYSFSSYSMLDPRVYDFKLASTHTPPHTH